MKLQSIFDSKNSQYKLEYFNIIKKYQNNPIKHYSLYEYANNFSLYTELHHINPRYYFNNLNIDVDNTKNNLIRVPFLIHVRLHELLVLHYQFIQDTDNLKSALLAYAGLDFNRILKNKKIHLTNNEKQQLLNERIKIKKQTSQTTPFKKYDYNYVKQLALDFNLYGFNYLKKTYSLCPPSPQKLYALFDRNNIKYQKRYDKGVRKQEHYSYNEIVKMNLIFNKYGYEYLKTNYPRIIPNIANLRRLFRKYNLQYNKKYEKLKNLNITYKNVKKLFNLYIKFGYKQLKNKTNTYIPCEFNLLNIFKKFNLDITANFNKRHIYSLDFLKQVSIDFFKYGFKYIQKKYQYKFKERSLIALLKAKKLYKK